MYVAGFYNHRIQKFDGSGAFLTKWGTHGIGPSAAGGLFNAPAGVVLDASGNVYVADSSNYRIQKFGDPWLDFFVGEPELLSGH